jgi:hypothetical protein
VTASLQESVLEVVTSPTDIGGPGARRPLPGCLVDRGNDDPGEIKRLQDEFVTLNVGLLRQLLVVTGVAVSTRTT